MHIVKIIVLLLSMSISVFGQMDNPIKININKADFGGKITLNIHNTSEQVIRVWQYDHNSWGWGNWSFEFFKDNEIIVFVRKPDEGFTVNVPFVLELKGSTSVDETFDLQDGTWVSHRIPLFSIYPTEEERKNFTSGCFAILSIPNSKESNRLNVWTGTVITPFREENGDDEKRDKHN